MVCILQSIYLWLILQPFFISCWTHRLKIFHLEVIFSNWNEM
jgi:hypothetical protein